MARILLVDDEDSYLEVLSDTLAIAGHKCIRAHDGHEGLEAAALERPDLVVTDQMMPRMTGIELIRALQDSPSLAAVPTVMLSAIRPPGFELATRFLQKPAHVDAIHRVVGELVRPETTAHSGAHAPGFVQTRGEALNWVAHEIKNPLGVALLNVELLQSRPVDDEFENRHLATLKRQLERMDELVKSVLDAASVEEGRVVLHRSRLEIGALVEGHTEEWRLRCPQHELDVTVRQRVACDVDRERIREILDNLVSNAVKYGGPEGKIEIEVDADAATAMISVRDHGIGIDPEDLPLIFDRFHRGRNGGHGHGLGLYIASALARLHGGSIRVESEVGVGSTFTLVLPRAG